MEENNKTLILNKDQVRWFNEEISAYMEIVSFDEKNETAAGIVNVLRFLIETQAEEPKPQKLQKSVYQQKIDEVASGKFEF